MITFSVCMYIYCTFDFDADGYYVPTIVITCWLRITSHRVTTAVIVLLRWPVYLIVETGNKTHSFRVNGKLPEALMKNNGCTNHGHSIFITSSPCQGHSPPLLFSLWERERERDRDRDRKIWVLTKLYGLNVSLTFSRIWIFLVNRWIAHWNINISWLSISFLPFTTRYFFSLDKQTNIYAHIILLSLSQV